MTQAISRRDIVVSAAMVAGVASVSYVGLSLTRSACAAEAYGTTPKNAVGYRDTPEGSHNCSNCSHFIAGPSATADGHCTVVAGTISPHGWCGVWTAKT